jgi:metal-sulfur cluster biosynthetic enzyme
MNKNEIYKVLEEVEEPTLGVDIVNLGLVYEVYVKDDQDVEIVMTTRNDDCLLADYIALSARQHLAERMGLGEKIDIKMVTAPKWTRDRMSRYARYLLDL